MRNLVSGHSFEERHKKGERSFTRQRKLPFQAVLELLLTKSVKSLQLRLNEWSENRDYRVSASALSQARRKFSYTAFEELHQKAVVDVMYEDGDYDKYRGYRLLAIDGSSLRLPRSKELIEEFGLVRHMNGHRQTLCNQVESKICVLYDLLNEIPISATLNPGRTCDMKACQKEISLLGEKDIVVADRGYVSYGFFAEIAAQKAHFIVRCKSRDFTKHHKLLESSKRKDVTVELPAPKKHSYEEGFLPSSMQVRFVRIDLPNGEVEILATSLLNKRRFPHSHFQVLYKKRWGIETYFQVLKSRLCIDNFSGKSLEAIKQDFYSTIFISGLETLIIEDATDVLQKRDSRSPLRVNKAISFHTIKNKVIKLILDGSENFMQEVTELFLMNPTSYREHRVKDTRIYKQARTRNSLYFQRYARKHIF